MTDPETALHVNDAVRAALRDRGDVDDRAARLVDTINAMTPAVAALRGMAPGVEQHRTALRRWPVFACPLSLGLSAETKLFIIASDGTAWRYRANVPPGEEYIRLPDLPQEEA
jgi:hypothetical protein